MLVFSTFLILALAALASAKTIEIAALSNSQGKNATFSPKSIMAEVGDIVVIRAQSRFDTFAIVEGKVDEPCAEASTKRLAMRAETRQAFLFDDVTSCPIKTQVTSFAIPDTNPLIVFSAINGQCLDGMILDVNFKGSPFQPHLSAATTQFLLDSTASAACVQPKISKQPQVASMLSTTSRKAQYSPSPGVIIGATLGSVALVAILAAFHVQRNRRIARLAQSFKMQQQQSQLQDPSTSVNYPPPPYSTNNSLIIDPERQPLTSK